tara:strand:+ start:1095 stop:1946 length:852 start_codon:yes stop_codon:yes gene_type:complete
MPNIPNIQTLTSQNVQSTLGQGGFARSNLYQVYIENGWGTDTSGKQPFVEHLKIPSLSPIYGFNWDNDFKKLLSFSCANATLPSSTYATGEVKDNFQGIVQEFAHTRINTDIDFSFYVDRDYKVLMFFEAWMNFVSGGNSAELREPSLYDEQITSNYYRRFQYPKFYKNASGVYITKFEKNYNVAGSTQITYQLIDAFPKSVSSIPLQYGDSEVSKITVTMYYDRYRVWRQNITPVVYTGQQQADLQLGLAQDAIVQAQNNPNYNGIGSFIYSPDGKPTGVSG